MSFCPSEGVIDDNDNETRILCVFIVRIVFVVRPKFGVSHSVWFLRITIVTHRSVFANISTE